jgi:hypothetical protein
VHGFLFFGCSGMESVGIDVEENAMTQEQSQSIIAACQGNKMLCLL